MSADNEATPEEYIAKSEEWYKKNFPADDSRAGVLRVALTKAVQEINRLRKELDEERYRHEQSLNQYM